MNRIIDARDSAMERSDLSTFRAVRTPERGKLVLLLVSALFAAASWACLDGVGSDGQIHSDTGPTVLNAVQGFLDRGGPFGPPATPDPAN